MSKISIYIGGLLCVIGVLSYIFTGFEHPTALIPVALGALIALCGWLTQKQPEKAKIYMHIAVTLALVGFIGSAARIPKLEGFGNIKSVSIWSSSVLFFILAGLYVQSFIKARTNKEVDPDA